jgi:hypothetical protein
MASNLFLESAKIPDASLDADAIGKKKYGFSQISLVVPTNLIDDCVIGIPLAAAVSGVNPWTFRQMDQTRSRAAAGAPCFENTNTPYRFART